MTGWDWNEAFLVVPILVIASFFVGRGYQWIKDTDAAIDHLTSLSRENTKALLEARLLLTQQRNFKDEEKLEA